MGIYLKNDERLIGDIGILWHKEKEYEIGFTLSPEFQKTGYAFEAVSAVLTYLKKECETELITASTDPENYSSVRLLEKLGFTANNILKNNIVIRGEWKDDLLFELRPR